MGIGKHTETEEEFVVYQKWDGGSVRDEAVSDAPIWIRPKEMFCGTTYSEKGETVPRFKHLGAF